MESKDKKFDIARFTADATGIPELEEMVQKDIRETEITSALEDIRVRKGLRQKDIAEKMGVSVSTVSRIEDSRDADLNYGDLTRYVNALGMTMTLFLEDPSLPAAEQIKRCVFMISDLLKKLTALAENCQNDKAIFDGIVRFQGEVLFNFMRQYAESTLDAPIIIPTMPESMGSQPQKRAATPAPVEIAR